MANETVSFEITANTENASKAITELQRKLNAMARIETTDKDTKAQQKVFAQMNKDLDGILEKEKDLGRHYTTYASRAKRVEKLTKEYEDQDVVLQKFIARQDELQAKSANGTITPAEVNELSRTTATVNNLTEKQAAQLKKINTAKRENEKLDRAGKNVLKQLVDKYGEIKSDESSVLGLKLEQVKGTEQAVASEGELDKEVNKTNSSLDKQAQSAKRAKSEFDKATNKSNRTKNIKQIIGETENIEEQISNIEKRASKVLSQPMAPNKFTFGDLKRRKEELEDVRKAIESIGTPKELDDFYQRLTVELDRVKQGMTALHNETKTTNKDLVTSTKQVADTAEDTTKRIEALKEQAISAMSMPMNAGEMDRGDLDQRIKQLEQIQSEIKKLGIPAELKEQYNQLGDELVKLKQKKYELDKAIKTPIKPDIENTIRAVASTTSQIDKAMQTNPATNNIAELLRRINALQEAKKTIEDLGLPRGADATYNRIIQLLAILTGQVSDYKKQLKDTSKEHEKTKKSGTTFVKSLLSAFRTLKSSMSTINRTTGKVKSSFDSMARSMKSNFKHMITNITKYVLGFRSLFFLVRRLRKYIGEGIQNLAKFNDGNNIVNESITDMLSSLLYLKNAWAAAFSPIITYVRPILVSLIDSLADVGNAIARFLSALLGQEIAFNAVRVRAQDYADSLDNAGGSASGAADKVKKLTDRLAAFDDLNVLGVDNDPDGTGGGGGGGLADEYVPDPNEMFKIVDPEQNGLLTMLKKAWETADFSPVGEAIKVKLIGVFQNIDWEDIKDKAGRFGTGAGSFIAGLFGDPKLFEEAGKTIGEGLNTVTTAISNFLDETEGVDFGGNLAKGFNEFLRTTDWETMGENISRTFTQVTDNINSFLDTLDDEELEKSIHDFIMKLDLPKLLADAGKTTIKLLGKLTIITVDIVKALGESLGDNLILYAQAKVQVTQLTQQGYDENGRPIEMPVYIEPEYDWTEHPFKALIEKILTDIGSFGVDVIFNVEGEEDLQKLIDLWLPIFGDNGDFFRVMDVIAGVIQGNPGKWITGVFGDNKDLEDLRTALDAIITIIRPLDAFAIADMFRDVDFGQLKDDIEKDFEDFSWGDLFGSIFGSSDLDDDGSSGKIGMVKDSWNSLGETSEKTYQKVKGDFKLLDTDLSEIWTTIQTTAETVATTLYDNLTTKWSEIKGSAYEKFVGVKTNITDKLQEAKDSAEEKVETLKTNLVNKWQEIKGSIYEKLVGIKTNVLEVFDQLKEAIKTPVNGFLSIIESMVNKVIYGINLLTSALNSLPDITMTNPFTGTEYALGFTIPPLNYVEIPRLAQGAVIPPNREFMAVLGDQSHGTNIEAPLDTIKQAVAEVLANNGNAEMIQLLQQLITVVESKNLVIGDKEIGKANARYVNQQKLIRGTSI